MYDHHANCACLFQSYIKKVSNNSEVLGLQNCYRFCIKPSNTGTVLGMLTFVYIIQENVKECNSESSRL
jgi:hypothetical protein